MGESTAAAVDALAHTYPPIRPGLNLTLLGSKMGDGIPPPLQMVVGRRGGGLPLTGEYRLPTRQREMSPV